MSIHKQKIDETLFSAGWTIPALVGMIFVLTETNRDMTHKEVLKPWGKERRRQLKKGLTS